MVRWSHRRRPTARFRRSPRLWCQRLETRLAPAVYTVLNNNDAGPGSLRDAVAAANATVGVADQIVFDPGFFSAPTTIGLSSGELLITDSLIITGTSAANVIIDGFNSTRLFRVDDGAASQIAVTFKNLTLQFGNATTALTPGNNDGGAIGIANEVVVVDNCRVLNNFAWEGGGVSVNGAGASLSIVDSTFEGNSAAGGSTPTQGGDGGAVNIEADNFTLTITRSTLRGNNAIDDGGAIYCAGFGSLTIDRSTISGNAANATLTADGTPNGGGALYWYGSVNATALIRGSTIANNTSQDDGGGIALRLVGGFTIQNSTITGNIAGGSSSSNGGGIFVFGGRAPLTLSSSIISGNQDGEVPDIWSAGVVTADFCAIGDPVGFRLAGSGNNLPFKADLFLGPLANNGGPTETIVPGPGSPAFNRGTANGQTVDQRGLPRVVGAAADIGATESANTVPTANISFPAPSLGATTWVITVVYTDDGTVDSNTINQDDLQLSGPGVIFGAPLFVSAGVSGPTVTAQYTFAAPDALTAGTWDFSDAGAYTITLFAGQVADTASNFVPGGILGEYRAGFARTFTVTSTAAAGPGSLDAAVQAANAQVNSTNTITFDPTVFAGAQTVTLTAPLNVTNPLVVNGPGSGKLTVVGSGRIFVVDNYGPVNFSLSGATLTGASTTGRGGAIYAFDDPLTITNCVITGNVADNDGAGIAQAIGNTLTVANSVITNNRSLGSAGDGAGIFTRFGATLSVTGSDISGNSSFFSGAAIYSRNDKVSIIDTTISGNVNFGTTNANAGGGGLYFDGRLSPADILIRNSTISDNVSGRNGGGILFRTGPAASKLAVQNSTIAGNRALGTSAAPGNSGGGISVTGTGAVTVTLESAILSGNVAASFADLSLVTTAAISAKNSAIGSKVGGTVIDIGANLFGAPINLGALGANGGTGATRLPAAGSPLINAGSNPAGLFTDQRGAGFPRSVGAGVDIGAAEFAGAPVAVTGPYADVLLEGGTSYDLAVTYIDDVAINTATLDNADITVTGPGGFSAPAKLITSPLPGNGSPIAVVYSFTPPGGSWDPADNGFYQVRINNGQVADTGATPVGAGLLGLIRVAVPAPLVVTTTTDAPVTKAGDAPGTLRQAIFDANANPGPDTITFDPTVFVTNLGQPTLINLSAGRLAVVDDLTILGLGTDRVAIDGVNNVGRRAMTISDSVIGRHLTVNISKLGFQNFFSFDSSVANDGLANGGAVLIADEFVTFSDVYFKANSSAAAGGAIHVLRSGTNLNLTRATFEGNVAQLSSTIDGGGAVRLPVGANATITDSSFEGNSAPNGVGGAIVNQGGGLLIERSAFISNANNAFNSSAFGGALLLLGSSPQFGWTIRNSTFFGNQSGGRGGAIGVNNFGSLNLGPVAMGATLTVQNSTITGNTSGLSNGGASPGGGIGSQYTGINFAIESSIVSGNFRGAIASDIGTVNAGGTRVFLRNSALGTLANIAGAASPGFDFVDRGNNLIGANLNLDVAPAFNGGMTKTVKFLGVSPAIDAGSNPAGLLTDQTGAARAFSVRPDMGAFESPTIQDLPRAVVNLPADVTAAGATTFTVAVDYYDATGVATGTIDTGDISVRGGAFASPVSPTGVTVAGSGSKVTATYTFTAPGGAFANATNGFYTVTLKANQVSDGTNFVTAADVDAGVFRSAVGKVLTVNSAADGTVTAAGQLPGSLRQAIFDANASIGTDTIQFAFAGPTTINLTAGELVITEAAVVLGQSAANSVVNQTGLTRVFRVAGPGVFQVSFDALTVSGGRPSTGGTSGAGILVLDEQVTISNSVIENNSTTASGGGIAVWEAGQVTVVNSVIRNNTAGAGFGGGIAVNRNGGAATLTNTTVSGNTAATNGGGVFSATGGGVQVVSSTLANNKAAGNGGGVGFTNRGDLLIRNSTLSGNTATTGGGVFLADYFLGTALIQNSTLTANSATSASATIGDGGGGIAWNTGVNATVSNFSAIQLDSSIVAGNFAATFADLTTNSPVVANRNLIGVADAGFTFTGTGNLTGTKAAPLDPQLDPLANNGGPTATHALKAGSPALNAGSNPAALAFDQRGTGFARLSGAGIDIGAFETQLASPPSKFTNIVINGGDPQRSRVTSVRVNFDSAVSFVGSPAAAFQLKRTPDNAAVTIAAAFTPGDAFVTLTFTGGAVDGAPAKYSLQDGRYALTILADQFAGGGFDGNGNGTAEGSPADNLTIASAANPAAPTNIFRLYGDGNGDGQVNAADFLQFRLAFLSADDRFDFDGDGQVGASDFLQFRLNFLKILP